MLSGSNICTMHDKRGLNRMAKIIDGKKVAQEIRTEFAIKNNNHRKLAQYTKSQPTRDAKMLEFKTQSKKLVSSMVKAFELRKNAEQNRKATTSKTGKLNPLKFDSKVRLLQV